MCGRRITWKKELCGARRIGDRSTEKNRVKLDERKGHEWTLHKVVVKKKLFQGEGAHGFFTIDMLGSHTTGRVA